MVDDGAKGGAEAGKRLRLHRAGEEAVQDDRRPVRGVGEEPQRLVHLVRRRVGEPRRKLQVAHIVAAGAEPFEKPALVDVATRQGRDVARDREDRRRHESCSDA